MDLIKETTESSLYLPLPSSQSIRLLTIFPGERGETIQSTLETVNLKTAPPYEALSYVWGPLEPGVEIVCNHQVIRVTPNLGTALQRLRYVARTVPQRNSLVKFWPRSKEDIPQEKFGERIVWIDAICINQTDLDERSQQVSLMRKIFSHASNVVIWLGEDNGSALKAITVVQKVAHYARVEAGCDRMTPDQITFEEPSSELKLYRDLPALHHPDWDAVYWLFRHDWFLRVWVLQEFAAAQNPIMMIGDLSLPGYDVAAAAQWLLKKNYASIFKGSLRLIAPATLLQLSSFSFLNILALTSHYKATDPRDRVYALLGLSNNNLDLESDTLLRPNYRKTVVEAYSDVVRHFISQPTNSGIWEGALAILGRNESFPLKGNGFEEEDDYEDDGFPSWVPRWDKRFFFWDKLSRSWLAQWWSTSGDSKVNMNTAGVGSSLILRGLKVTEVADLGRSLERPKNRNPPEDEKAQAIVQALLKMATENLSEYLGSEETLKRAFAATITAGNPRGRFGREPFHEGDIEAFLLYGTRHDDGGRLYTALRHMLTFFITGDGHMGIGSRKMQNGDHVCILFGGKVPYILRQVGDHFKLVGECYIHGLMNGEVMGLWKAGQVHDQWVHIQ